MSEKIDLQLQQQVPLMEAQPPECPPSYDQATGTYPNQQGSYPTQQGGYPTIKGRYPTEQGGYPPQDGYDSKPGTYPTTQPFMQVSYTTPAIPISETQAPITQMEREPVRTVCDGCHNQVIS